MGKAPRATSAEVERVLTKKGFTLDRSKGSHRIYSNAAGTRVTVPHHGADILHPKTLASIVRDMGLTMDEFAAALKG